MRTVTETGPVHAEMLEGTSKATPDKEVSDDEERGGMWLLARTMRTEGPGTSQEKAFVRAGCS